jgi:hypothetical protein
VKARFFIEISFRAERLANQAGCLVGPLNQVYAVPGSFYADEIRIAAAQRARHGAGRRQDRRTAAGGNR